MTIAPVGNGMIAGVSEIERLLAPRFAQPNIQAPVNMPIDPSQPQQPLGGGVWGSGGRLITPEQAQQQRAQAQELMAIDYSPIGSPWQGLARVLGNVQGALQARGVKKAEERTAEHNKQLMEQLRSGMSGGADGSSPTSAPNIEALLLDKYASPEVRAAAQRQVDMREYERKKQIEHQYRPVPESVQLSRIANDPTYSPEDRKAASDALALKLDPFVNFSGPDIGTYVGRQSGLGAFLGGGSPAPVAEPPATLPRDFNQGGPVPSASGNFPL